MERVRIKMKKLIAIILVVGLVLSGCGAKGLPNSYEQKDASFYFLEDVSNHSDRFAANLAVIPKISNLEGDFDKTVNSALLINNTKNEVLIADNPHAKIYPASITKLMTALIVLKYAKMDDIVTIKEDIVFNETGVVKIPLQKGDKISVKDLFEGLLVYSANDCGVVLARHISGSVKKFATLMNKEAKAIGATNTHFMNPHGLHDDNHYTTAYDLYLMLKEVSQYEEFTKTIAKKSCTLSYTNQAGNPVKQTFPTTNLYINKTYALPADVTMIGGKSGTTSLAGSSLILLTQNAYDEQFISVIMGAADKPTLYDAMSNLLARENK